MSARDSQVGGDHYRCMRIQPSDFILANDIRHHEGSIIEYVVRWRAKNGLIDLKKARHLLDLLIEHEETQERLRLASEDTRAPVQIPEHIPNIAVGRFALENRQ